ncbi:MULTISPECIES: AAA family ATPase [Haloferax]|uniref:AAA family ATPase n=2 Tax=Haloferax TaxID=2251 RepID=A0A6G1Z775_9EURY|nr:MULTISPECIES: SMC family ATPase [Haloferax]KAB1184774.1 SMC family ATPase [Haloferax sp. CBA1149]MRW82406.1 AAA family ATPase [Haloferax marinisediminis]
MKILGVTLENIKSYEDRTEVPLQEGVTAILGENGSGKSTIQEAIGFALFDSLPFNNNEFVREGASSGIVEVIIELDEGKEGQRYRVTRSAGYSKYGVARYDSQNDEWINQDIDSKKGLVDWLCAKFNLEDGDELSKLWESCLGVPQTRFLSDFAQTARNRQKTFDELLGIDAYENSWNVLKGVPDEIEAERRRVREDIRELTGEVQSLPKEREEKRKLEEEVEQISGEIESARSELSEVEERHEELDDISERITELETKIQQKEQAIEAKENALGDAENELEAAQQAADKCEAAREGYEQYDEAKERQDQLEDDLSELNQLREERQERDGKLGRLQTQKETLQEQVEKYEQAKENIDTHESDKDRYEELDERISDLESDRKTVERLRGEIDSLDTDARDDLDELRRTIETIEEIETEAAEVADAGGLRDRKSEVKGGLASLNSEESELRERLENLRDADADSPCPTCGKPLEGEHRTKTIEEREGRLEEIQEERQAFNEELSELQDELEEAKRVETRVAQLDMHKSRAGELREDLGDLAKKREETREQITSLTEGIEQMPDLEDERDSLEAAKDAYRTATVQAKEYADAPDKLVDVEESIESVEAEMAQLDEEIAEFGDVEDELESVKGVLKESEDDYRQFERNRQTANKLEAREEAVAEIEQALANLREEHDLLNEDFQDERESFDEDEYESLSKDIEKLKGRINTLNGTKSAKEEELKGVAATVEDLEEKLSERKEAIEKLRELAADQQFATWVRDNVRAAGPKMRDVITDRIGKRADTIFRSIRGRKAEQLEWTSDYDIVVVDADVRKSFSTLSGGEKMAAALAVRLAILEQISGLGIAFLDEPTANLDEDKKANLVAQLNGLDAFEQLTVISHDSTFDSMTDYSVTIEKPNQTSEVMSD